jgi:hypothetical protein
MFDFIFGNAFYLLIAAVFIGRLILQITAKGRKDREAEKKPSPRPPAFFRMEEGEAEADESETPAGEGGRISYSRTRGSSDYLRDLVLKEAAVDAAKPPSAPATAPRPAPVKMPQHMVLPAAEALPSAQKNDPAPRVESRSARRGAGGFPAGLERLPSLKKAVILAEILGPPKGM